MQQQQQTDIAKFQNPHSLGNKIARMAWAVVYRVLFRPTPWFMVGWRRFVLRCFGAKLGNTHVHASTDIWAPWLLEAGDNVYIDRDVILYNTYGITLGNRVVISRGAFLCTPTHDHTVSDFPLTGARITVGNDTWIAAQVFVAPGVTIGDGAVVGARAVVIKPVAPWTVVAGNPARLIRTREVKPAASATGAGSAATPSPGSAGSSGVADSSGAAPSSGSAGS